MDCVYETYEGKDLSQLKRVTLVIPTYNRNYYLSRCLWYHAHFPFAEIIVADSSDENKRQVNRQTISDIHQMFPTKITYLEYNFPAEKYGGEIYRKWGDAVMHVNTEYSLSCTDKEFLIPTTVADSVNFLDQNPDYSIADGRYYLMMSSKLIVPWQGDNDIRLTSNDINIRLQGILEANHPIGTQFALQHSINHKTIFDNLERYGIHDLRFGETSIELLPILFGKMNRDTSNTMCIRDVTHNMSRKMLKIEYIKAESSFTRNPPLYHYPHDRYQDMSNKLLRCLEYNGLTSSNKEDIIKHVMQIRYYDDKMRSKALQNNTILQYIWKNLLPYVIKEKISKYLGSGMVTPSLKYKHRTTEIKIICDIINRTDKFHKKDETCHNKLEVNL